MSTILRRGTRAGSPYSIAASEALSSPSTSKLEGLKCAHGILTTLLSDKRYDVVAGEMRELLQLVSNSITAIRDGRSIRVFAHDAGRLAHIIALSERERILAGDALHSVVSQTFHAGSSAPKPQAEAFEVDAVGVDTQGVLL